VGDALAVDPAPQRRAKLVGGGAGAHLAVGGQVELEATLAPGIVPHPRQLRYSRSFKGIFNSFLLPYGPKNVCFLIFCLDF